MPCAIAGEVKAHMKKWNMIIDVAECTNCNLCTLAAMDEYVGNDWPGYSAPMPKHGHKWINILQKERGQVPMIDIAYVPTMCNHCDDAPCIKAAQERRHQEARGRHRLIDPVKAKGQKHLVDACPYGHIWWNEELQLPQAWTFDAHLIDQGWQQTRGQQSCPTGAMRADQGRGRGDGAHGARGRPRSDEAGARRQAARLLPQPVALFEMLHRRLGLGESKNGVVDCVEGASVQLVKDGASVAVTTTDNYGDFKFDRLDENSGRYTVQIFAGGRSKTVRSRTSAPASISARSGCSRRRRAPRDAALARLGGAFGGVGVAIDHCRFGRPQ